MSNRKECFICGMAPLVKDEIGLTKKLLDKNAKKFFCFNCLAEHLDVSVDDLLFKVEEFKEQGCELF